MADPFFGPALSLLSKTTEKPLYLSDAWKNALDASAAQLGSNQTSDNASLADYAAGINKAKGQIEPLVQQDIGTLGGQINRSAAYDPFGTLKQTGDYFQSLFDKTAGNIASMGQRNVNLARAATYGGRDVGPGGGSYDTNLLLNNISRNLAPAWANVINQINPAYQSQQQDRAMNLAQLQAMMAERRGLPLTTANLALLPIQARQNELMGNLAAGGAAADALRKLYRGSQVTKNWAGRLLDQTNAAWDSGMNMATSLAGDAVAAYTGGAAGKAGGGAVAVPPPASTMFSPAPYTAPPYEGTTPPPGTQPNPWGTIPPPTYYDPNFGSVWQGG